jgi:hypothetical protein
MEGIMHNHFKNLLGKKVQRQETINWDMLELPQLPTQCLESPFSEFEIGKAIVELPTEKASGPNGFTCLFYKSCWGITKAEVVAAFQCLYSLTTAPYAQTEWSFDHPAAKKRKLRSV